MEVPAFLSPFLDGESPKRLFQGLAVGAIATVIIGFNWGGWHLGGTVDEKVAAASEMAMVTALAPICAAKFQQAATAENDMVAKLNAVSSWERDSHLMKAGWATFPGGAKPDTAVAEACATMLGKTFKLK